MIDVGGVTDRYRIRLGSFDENNIDLGTYTAIHTTSTSHIFSNTYLLATNVVNATNAIPFNGSERFTVELTSYFNFGGHMPSWATNHYQTLYAYSFFLLIKGSINGGAETELMMFKLFSSEEETNASANVRAIVNYGDGFITDFFDSRAYSSYPLTGEPSGGIEPTETQILCNTYGSIPSSVDSNNLQTNFFTEADYRQFGFKVRHPELLLTKYRTS